MSQQAHAHEWQDGPRQPVELVRERCACGVRRYAIVDPATGRRFSLPDDDIVPVRPQLAAHQLGEQLGQKLAEAMPHLLRWLATGRFR